MGSGFIACAPPAGTLPLPGSSGNPTQPVGDPGMKGNMQALAPKSSATAIFVDL